MTNVPEGILPGNVIRALSCGEHPLITPCTDRNLQPCSYDMSIGTIFGKTTIIGRRSSETHVLLQPGDIISVFTLEEVDLPDNVAATVFPPNSLSLHGLLVLNPGHIDPGFRGPLSAKVVNISSVPKTIARGGMIFTIVFEKLAQSVGRPYVNQYVDREQRETEFFANDVQQNPGSLGKMLERGSHVPIVSAEQVRKIVQEHWLSYVVLGAALIAAVASVIAVVQGMTKDDKRQTAPILENQGASSGKQLR
jgi:deoxycytidine triphosphate deaminase